MNEDCTCEEGEYRDLGCPQHGKYNRDDALAFFLEPERAHCDHCTPESPCPPRCVLCATDKFYAKGEKL